VVSHLSWRIVVPNYVLGAARISSSRFQTHKTSNMKW
jgi:hypothetical protein